MSEVEVTDQDRDKAEQLRLDVLNAADYMPCPYNDPHNGSKEAAFKEVIALALAQARDAGYQAALNHAEQVGGKALRQAIYYTGMNADVLALAEWEVAYQGAWMADAVRSDKAPDISPLRWVDGKRCAPESCVLDDQGRVLKVDGILPIAANAVKEAGR
jgi:hypothetical protein